LQDGDSTEHVRFPPALKPYVLPSHNEWTSDSFHFSDLRSVFQDSAGHPAFLLPEHFAKMTVTSGHPSILSPEDLVNVKAEGKSKIQKAVSKDRLDAERQRKKLLNPRIPMIETSARASHWTVWGRSYGRDP
jgi:hypothetical protein